MGCGSSQPGQTSSSKANTASDVQAPIASQIQKPPLSNGAKQQLTSRGRSGSEDDLAFNQQAIAPNTGKAEDVTPSVQSTLASSERGQVSTPSLLSSRQSLIAGSGSLGSKLGRSNLLPAGWSPGMGVLIWDDPRTAHITNLACTVMKVPIVAILSHGQGRLKFSASKGLQDLGSRTWLAQFCSWVAMQELSGALVIADTLQDPRSRGCGWVKGSPGIRFIALSSIQSMDGERLATMCALDVMPHGRADGGSAMLPNLSNMAARELDGCATPDELGREYVISGLVLPADLRESMDAYSWTTVLLEVSPEKWTILYANDAFRTATGIPPGCLEGYSFWDFFAPMSSSEPRQADAHAANIQAGEPFTIGPILFQPQLPGATAQYTKQLFRVELRRFDEETATTFGVQQPHATSEQWIAGFRPEARLNLDVPAVEQVTGDPPFPALELGPVIGKGSFGYVCRGALGYLIVAVKIIEAESIFRVDADGTPLEVSLAKNLRHPNIVQVLDYATRVRKNQPISRIDSSKGSKGSQRSKSWNNGECHDSSDTQQKPGSSQPTSSRSLLGGDSADGVTEAWLILEYCDLGTLMDGIEREWLGTKPSGNTLRKVNLSYILAVAFEIASAMRYLHKHNILHGDLTAGNVLLASAPISTNDQRGFRAKVADFGLSRQALTSRVETNSYGTVTHMPPELLNDGLLSKHADVYAFGVLVVEMYSGTRAFSGMRQPQVIHTIAVLKKHPELPASAPEFLKDLAQACLQDEYKKRPPFAKIMDILQTEIVAQRQM